MPRTVTEWVMAFLLVIALWCGFFGFLGQSLIASVTTIILIGLVVLIGIIAYDEVPSGPPSVAMPVILNKRYTLSPDSIGEGPVFVFRPIEDLVVRNYLPVVVPFAFDGVRCLLKADEEKVPGGLVTVEGSITIVPDIKMNERFMTFLNKGGHLRFRRPQTDKLDTTPVGDGSGETSPIIEQILAMLGQAVREYGGTKTWDELTFAKASLSVKLITMLTGLEPESENEATIKEFLAQALIDGVADIIDLGIMITRLNVEEVAPEGGLKENADKAANELLQRTAEQTDIGTAIKLAQEFLEAWGIDEEVLNTMSRQERQQLMEKALELVRIERRRATENIVRSSGNPFADAAAMLNNPGGKNPPEKGPDS